MARYREDYEYDQVGNITNFHHVPDSGSGWTRVYTYETDNNRLATASEPVGVSPNPYPYTYNAHGSMTSMAHLQGIDWDFAERMQRVNKGGGGNVYFTYDASGQRVRKVWAHNNITEERIYLGGYEIYRRTAADYNLERQTLHVMDDQRRVAMLETKTVDTRTGATVPTTRWRFQLDNHLGSAMLEVDAQANIVSYEEYHPYGTSALRLSNGDAEVSAKRYRYTGKERDEETSLYYHGARYYAPWLGRWTAADPAGMVDGLNLYRYSRDNPICFSDKGGTQSTRGSYVSELLKFLRNPTLEPTSDAPMKPREMKPDTESVFQKNQHEVSKHVAGMKPSEAEIAKGFEAWWSGTPGAEGSYAQWKANAANTSDRGGATAWGVTYRTYKAMRPKGTFEQFQSLTKEDAKQIARSLYSSYGADRVKNPGVAMLLAESFWGGYSPQALNRALVRADQLPVATETRLSDETVAAINRADPQTLINALADERLRYYKQIVQRDPSQAKFLYGWSIRLSARWVQAKILTGHADEAAAWLSSAGKKVSQDVTARLSKEDRAKLQDATPRPSPKPGRG